MLCLNIKEGCNIYFYLDVLFNFVVRKRVVVIKFLFELFLEKLI